MLSIHFSFFFKPIFLGTKNHNSDSYVLTKECSTLSASVVVERGGMESGRIQNPPMLPLIFLLCGTWGSRLVISNRSATVGWLHSTPQHLSTISTTPSKLTMKQLDGKACCSNWRILRHLLQRRPELVNAQDVCGWIHDGGAEEWIPVSDWCILF